MISENKVQKEDGQLSEWDKAVIVFFTVFLLGMAIYYWYFWSDLWVPLLTIISALTLYVVSVSENDCMYKPIVKYSFPIIETAIVLMILLNWIIVIQPLLGFDFGVTVIGSLLFEFCIPYLLFVKYFGYKRQSVGIEIKRSDSDQFVMAICTILLLSRFLILLFSPYGLTNLVNNLTFLISGIIFIGFIIGFIEEFIFRGIIQNRVALHFGSRVFGVVFTSLFFAATHVFSEMVGLSFTPVNIGSALIYALMTRLPLGIILGLVWNDSENLIGVTLIHASNNIAFLLQSLTGL